MPSADYNHNGLVDAADYVLWRKTQNTSVQPGTGADGTGDGMIDGADYNLWRLHFGNPSGAGAGGVLGGALGWLAGIGALAIPGVGPFIAAGPIMAALAGVGVGGAVGGLIGALVGMGIPEYEAKRYEGRVRQGGVLLSVHADNSDWVKRAKDLLRDTGAEDI